MKKKTGWMVLLLALAFSLSVSISVSAASKDRIVSKNGKKYYYDTGGKLVTGKYGYKIGKNYYRINSKGVITKISAVQGMAGEKLNPYYGRKYTDEQRLKKAFAYAAGIAYYTNNTRTPANQSPQKYFGTYGFTYERGDCNVQAAVFYWMAKALGYKVKFVQGYVIKEPGQTAEKNDAFGSHAWCTIKMDHTNYVFDPNFASSCGNQDQCGGLKPGYQFTYGTENTYQYFDKNHTIMQ